MWDNTVSMCAHSRNTTHQSGCLAGAVLEAPQAPSQHHCTQGLVSARQGQAGATRSRGAPGAGHIHAQNVGTLEALASVCCYPAVTQPGRLALRGACTPLSTRQPSQRVTLQSACRFLRSGSLQHPLQAQREGRAAPDSSQGSLLAQELRAEEHLSALANHACADAARQAAATGLCLSCKVAQRVCCQTGRLRQSGT